MAERKACYPDHKYYNMQIKNTSGSENMVASFAENRTVPLLHDPGEWRVAVARFRVPMSLVPLFTWPNNAAPNRIETGQNPQTFPLGVCSTPLNPKASLIKNFAMTVDTSVIQDTAPITGTFTATAFSNHFNFGTWNASALMRAGMYVHCSLPGVLLPGTRITAFTVGSNAIDADWFDTDQPAIGNAPANTIFWFTEYGIGDAVLSFNLQRGTFVEGFGFTSGTVVLNNKCEYTATGLVRFVTSPYTMVISSFPLSLFTPVLAPPLPADYALRPRTIPVPYIQAQNYNFPVHVLPPPAFLLSNRPTTTYDLPVTSYNQLLESVNQCLLRFWNMLLAVTPAIFPGANVNIPPTFVYDEKTSLISVKVDPALARQGILASTQNFFQQFMQTLPRDSLAVLTPMVGNTVNVLQFSFNPVCGTSELCFQANVAPPSTVLTMAAGTTLYDFPIPLGSVISGPSVLLNSTVVAAARTQNVPAATTAGTDVLTFPFPCPATIQVDELIVGPGIAASQNIRVAAVGFPGPNQLTMKIGPGVAPPFLAGATLDLYLDPRVASLYSFYGNTITLSNATLVPAVAYTTPLCFKSTWCVEVLSQESPSVGSWFQLESLFFATSSIPVDQEQLPSVDIGSGQAAFRPILTDFEPLASDGPADRNALQYYPQGPYRLISMLGQGALFRTDLQILWRSKEGVIYPLLIAPGENASVKLMFARANSGPGTRCEPFP